MKIFENVSIGYKRIAAGIAIVSFLAIMYMAMIPGAFVAAQSFVMAASGDPIVGAFVKLTDYPQYNATTDVNGNYTMNNVPVGTYNISATKDGYYPNRSTVTVIENSTVVKNFTLSPASYKYFAAGAIEPGIETYIQMSNPAVSPLNVDLEFMLMDGTVITKTLVIPSNTSSVVNVKDVLPTPSYFATRVVSDMEIAADRKQIFTDYVSLGAIVNDATETVGTSGLNTTWYFGAGAIESTTIELIQILNPNNQSATVTAELMLTNGTVINSTKVVAPTSRSSIDPRTALSVPSYFSARVTSDIPVMTERTMVFANATVSGYIANGLHNTIGSTELSKTWYFAAGAIEPYTNEVILIMNPSSSSATVTAEYMLTNGTVINGTTVVGPTSRGTMDPRTVLSVPSYFSARVTSDVPVMVERTMTFAHTDVGGGKFINGYHNTIGSTKLSTKWSIGGGYVEPGISSLIQILNPNPQVVNLTTKFMLTNGTVILDTRQVTGNSRSSINSGTIVPTGWYSAQVTSDIPIFIEKTETYAGAMWNGRYVDGYANTIASSV